MLSSTKILAPGCVLVPLRGCAEALQSLRGGNPNDDFQ
jgi:hypothetical protein